ncbi:hypothetical protein, partial [Planococcus sp. CAU13]|uniref:hypothetical protein n=1 Tax=Planococcus sp. CAU13 TaxID=1541197 RepID=UPI00052FF7B8
EIIERNAAGAVITHSPPLYDSIRALEIGLVIEGKTTGSSKQLKGIFSVEVPETFLSADKKLTVQTVTKTENLTYNNIFYSTWPTKTCESLKQDITAKVTPLLYDCLMGTGEQVKDFADWLKNQKLDPADFTVFTPSLKENICGGKANCNSAESGGVMVVARPGDASLLGNMNNLNNANLIVDGHLRVEQFQNPGTKSDSQTIIMRQLTVSKHMHGQGLENTNLLILGKATGADAAMNFMDKVTIGDNGRVCFDLDRIKKADWEAFRDKVDFKNNNTTGQIIYFTENLAANPFILPKDGSLSAAERTKLYVQGYDNYTNFLSSCGVNVSQNIKEITDIPVPYVTDPDFDLDVDYNPETDIN